MSSIREALSAALEAQPIETVETVETVTETAPVETPVETESAKAERLRDDGGRFAAKQAETVAPEPRKPPSSWKKDYWDHWAKLDPNVQTYMEQRESDFASGVSQHKQRADQAEPFYKAVQPFIPGLQQRGVAPDRWLADLGHVDRILSSGTPEQKADLITRMAAANGIDLQGLVSGQVNPQFGHMAQTVNGLQQKWQAFESQQEQAEQARMQETIKSFSADKPHFEAVRGTMGQLLQSGVATDLPTAYDKAIRLHDDIWQQHQASQAEAANRQSEIAKKKAAASSPKSASPTGAQVAGNGKKGLREMLSESFDNVVAGRV